MTAANPLPPVSVHLEGQCERYARQQRNATVLIAVIACVLFVVMLVGVIGSLAYLHSVETAINGSSSSTSGSLNSGP